MIVQEPSFSVIRFSDRAHYKDGSFLLTQPMIFDWVKKRCRVTVDAGFITNFASIPAGLTNVFPVNDRHRLPAVAHDYLYSKAGTLQTLEMIRPSGEILKLSKPATILYTRFEADQLFRDFMLSEGVGSKRAQMMFFAVQHFGQKNWGKP